MRRIRGHHPADVSSTIGALPGGVVAMWRTNAMLEIALIGACLLAAGCGTTPIAPNERGTATVPPTTMPPPPAVAAPAARGGYYLDDGPGENPPDLAALADAKPKLEPLHRAALRPYVALGKSYTPMTQVAPYKARGTATWYGKRYHGKPTSTGDRYDMYAMTAAHTTLPLPSYVRVTSVANGRSVVVRVNDRGPFHSDRLIDLSYAAAWKLGLVTGGSGVVDVEAIVPDGSGVTTAAVVEPVSVAPPADVDRDSAPVAATTGVFLQLGAFSERAFADDFTRKMRVELPDLAQPIVVIAGDNLHRVQSGPFPDRDSARREAERVAARLGGNRPFIVTR